MSCLLPVWMVVKRQEFKQFLVCQYCYPPCSATLTRFHVLPTYSQSVFVCAVPPIYSHVNLVAWILIKSLFLVENLYLITYNILLLFYQEHRLTKKWYNLRRIRSRVIQSVPTTTRTTFCLLLICHIFPGRNNVITQDGVPASNQ